MVSIYDLAKDGTVTEVTLRGLAWSKIPFFSDKTQLRPLGIAVWNGHVDVARLLFDYNTEPNGNRQGLPPISRWRRARFAGRRKTHSKLKETPSRKTHSKLKDDSDSRGNSKPLVKEYSLKEVIKDCGDKLEKEEYPRTDEPSRLRRAGAVSDTQTSFSAVRFQIGQTGADEEAKAFAKGLKDAD
ncbi:hypothetical protein BBO_07430 [Beauveria brongniartii RCEF 3172]|uniref:Ankyrin repeat-containing domain protein n=1 Tax=Beauveria brongniartii RCEF 3172 TaxID=1081107 RepID=A0A166ZAN4_9HYPO|nr:hypothetical protein BBO_07430 [Beauveria brongniartii RCEF 3172]